MSSSHYIIIARHEDGRLELPLGDMTIYGCELEGEEAMFHRIRERYSEEWTLAWYQPMDAFYGGGKP